jgi:hypothetical protein
LNRRFPCRAVFMTALIFMTIASSLSARDQKRIKKRIAVLKITTQEDLSTPGRIMRNSIEYRLFQTGFYDILERDQVDIILKEKKQRVTPCNDKKCAARIGSLVSADYVIIGTLNRSKEYDINVKVINVSRNTIVVNIAKDRSSLENIRPFSEKLADELHGKLIDVDKGIQLPHAGSVFFSTDFSYLTPAGGLSDILGTGYGATLQGGIKHTLVDNLFLGLSLNALSFRGKSRITHHAMLLPVFLEAAYEYDIHPLSLFLFGSGGGSYNSNSYYRYTSGTDYYTISSWQAMTRFGAGINLTLRRYLTISLKSALWQIYEDSSTRSFVSLSAGIGLKF